MSEKVLCVARGELPAEWVAAEVAVPASIEVLEHLPFDFIERGTAEQDETLKQLIPYALVRSCADNSFACYLRQGNEDRLHGLRSLGVGGHINPEDAAGSLPRTVLQALRRELEEEFAGFDCRAGTERFIGVINEENTPVGRVHLGLVFLVDVPGRVAPGDELADLRWLSIEDARQCNLELWSRLALRCL